MLLQELVVPKSKTKLVVAKIRDVTSYGMLCSESELNLSDESDGITELSSKKYEKVLEKVIFQNQIQILLIYQLHLIDQIVLVLKE